jgi:ABC-2 type transport system ATP-binding protein
MPAIQLSALSKQFGDVSAVDQLSLEVPSGTLFGFLGPNGAGKTTTIRMLLGLISPCSGTGKVMGYDIRTEADQIRARTGALLEHTVIYERMSAIDNLEFYGRIFRIPPADRLQRIKGLLQEMGLWDRRHDLAGSWSRGMKQRLALARVLLHKPKLVFLDEPTAGLDIVSAAKIREKLSRLVEKDQLTVFLTTHNMAEVEQICSQVSLIKEGKLIAQGSPDQLRSMRDSHRFLIKGKGLSDAIVSRLSHRPEIQFVQRINHGLELDIRDREKKSDLVTWLVGEGVHIEEIRQDQEKLEDVFITLLEEKNDH